MEAITVWVGIGCTMFGGIVGLFLGSALKAGQMEDETISEELREMVG